MFRTLHYSILDQFSVLTEGNQREKSGYLASWSSSVFRTKTIKISVWESWCDKKIKWFQPKFCEFKRGICKKITVLRLNFTLSQLASFSFFFFFFKSKHIFLISFFGSAAFRKTNIFLIMASFIINLHVLYSKIRCLYFLLDPIFWLHKKKIQNLSWR